MTRKTKDKVNDDWNKYCAECERLLKEYNDLSLNKPEKKLDWNEYSKKLYDAVSAYNEVKSKNKEPRPVAKIYKSKWNTQRFRWLASAAAICIITLSIVLPLTLPNRNGGIETGDSAPGTGSDGGDNTIFFQYNSNDNPISVSTFLERISSKLFFSEGNYIYYIHIDEDEIKTSYFTDDNGNVLSYLIENFFLFLGDPYDPDTEIFYQVSFRIVTDSRYRFAGFDHYNDLDDSDYFNGTNVSFRINSDMNFISLRFKYDANEYFITLHGWTDAGTTVSRISMERIISSLLGDIL
ncbi:MAG: hypothetical protein FWC00_05560 [Firmicutes bacterium]|nr:hypothetical protein [Bacillota bacterium]